ncbi:hypothetical protein [[Phormidium] sp. ETS-05]|uniref:hypothetical protein n=1 Tax=[Phormidium] sp. ETS-05 TaxID=222819 RepID=UPI0018EEE60F|nr:hypothetical protein [[Phormidium] sp. ETS-05]
MARRLLDLAAQVNLKTFLKHPRSPKKKKPPLILEPKHRHLSPTRLLEQNHLSPRRGLGGQRLLLLMVMNRLIGKALPTLLLPTTTAELKLN